MTCSRLADGVNNDDINNLDDDDFLPKFTPPREIVGVLHFSTSTLTGFGT
ncbi:hypothetical protein BVRB_9g213420 [Beta vulgaris subsp. vulgaris]|nr:hypothetical protein BVRB_9g213420 [Beta vulgaris subsp. vulgaris]